MKSNESFSDPVEIEEESSEEFIEESSEEPEEEPSEESEEESAVEPSEEPEEESAAEPSEEPEEEPENEVVENEVLEQNDSYTVIDYTSHFENIENSLKFQSLILIGVVLLLGLLMGFRKL